MPAGGYSAINEASDYTLVNTTTFTDIDSTDLALTFTTGGGDVILIFTGSFKVSATTQDLFLDIHESVGAARLGGDDGLLEVFCASSTFATAVCLVYRARGLSAASHTFKMQWKASGAITLTLFAGAGTSGHDTHPDFSAFEI